MSSGDNTGPARRAAQLSPIVFPPPQRESRALIMRQDCYANYDALCGQGDVSPEPFLQTRIMLYGERALDPRCGEDDGWPVGATVEHENGLFP